MSRIPYSCSQQVALVFRYVGVAPDQFNVLLSLLKLPLDQVTMALIWDLFLGVAHARLYLKITCAKSASGRHR